VIFFTGETEQEAIEITVRRAVVMLHIFILCVLCASAPLREAFGNISPYIGVWSEKKLYRNVAL